MTNSIDLNGVWKLRWSDGYRNYLGDAEREQVDERRYLDAIVPGEVHLDLMRAGLIDDPYIQANVLKARWVEECYWTYRRRFDVSEEAVKARAWLVFEGLDYAATILLNGQEVGRHANFFYPCRIDVTGKLKASSNLLVIHLDAGLFGVSDKQGSGFGFTFNYDQLLHKRHWLRKPQCQFEWDWSQRLINVGIHKPARVEWTSDIARMDQTVPLATVSPDLKSGAVRVRQFIETWDNSKPKAEISAELLDPSGKSVAKTSSTVELNHGTHAYEANLAIDNPALWWPVNHGRQDLYTLRVTVSANGSEIGQTTSTIGFRRVRINQDAHPHAGQYFTIEINNRKVFAKGGNFVPADMIFARIDRSRYEKLIDLALEQNFNMLRVWGGGLYEADEFYDICDRKGILVWQEFIFACSRYPIQDIAFFNNIQTEARYNVRRLASHPSLVIWCGNNELEWGAWDWNYPKEGYVLPDHALFHVTLPRIMNDEDPTRPYHPSSPYSPEGNWPNRDDMGDQHPWRVSFGTADFREYRSTTSRFPNEGGYLGPTALPTVLACLPANQRYVGSFAWEVHENAMAVHENVACLRCLPEWFGKRDRDLSVEDWVYWAGLLQGEALREYCDNFRRRMFDTSAAIFWMYNDTWPTPRSWTTVDYYLRRTPAFHPVRRAMAPIHVVVTVGAKNPGKPAPVANNMGTAPAVQPAEQVSVWGINETQQPVTAELRYGVFNLAGGYPVDRGAQVVLPPNSSTRIAAFDIADWKAQDASAAFAMLSSGGNLISRNRLFLPLFKDLKWPGANVKVRVENGRAVFSSETFAWGVCLDLAGETAIADNFFDVWPGIDYPIPWQGPAPRILRTGNLL